METLVIGALVPALVLKFTDFLKGLTNRDWNKVVTQLVTWGGATLALFLAGATQWAGDIVIVGTQKLADYNFADTLLAGTAIGSVGSVVFDLKKAFDNTDSAAEPPLVPPSSKKAA